MKRTVIFVLTLAILLNSSFAATLICVRAEASESLPVHNMNTGLDYSTIQASVDADETVNGHTILVDAGTYREHIVVSKSLALIGNGSSATTIDGIGTGAVVTVATDNVLIRGFSIINGLFGILLNHSSNCSLVENRVAGITDFYAVYASYSDNCTIEGNLVGPNSCSGILVTNSLNFTILGNYVHENEGYGLNANASMDGLMTQNYALNNSYDGIGLGRGCRNCTITLNNVSDNRLYGLWLDSDSVDNLIYDNNVINNDRQVSVFLANRWDNGFEGNFWSNYKSVDEDHNGIADVPAVLGNNNIDNYPLMGSLSIFSTSLGFTVNVISNSSITSFQYYDSNGTIRMGIGDPMKPGDYGFCRMLIPHSLMTEPYNTTVDGANPFYWNYTLLEDGKDRWIYFAYQGSPHTLMIRGTPPPREEGFPWLLIITAIAAIAVVASAILVYHRKRRKKSGQMSQQV